MPQECTEPPPPRVTLSAVAARAGVSASTASLAFSGRGPVSEEARERVLRAAAELDYAGPDPRAASLRRGASGIVGVHIADRIGVSFRDPVLIHTLDGLAEALAPIGSSLLLIPDLESGELTAQTAPIDALVMTCTSADGVETARILARRGIPCVQIEGPETEGLVNIGLDNRGGSRRLAEHLWGLGHRRVGLVCLPIDRRREVRDLTEADLASATVAVTRERILGAREVYPGATGVIAGASRADAGRLAALELLRPERGPAPTAIIAQSDLLAHGVLLAAEELGLRVPEDLSVVGFDGIPIPGLDRRLTTVWQPAHAKGKAAGAALVRLLAGEPAVGSSFEVTLTLGDTSGPVPGGGAA